MEKNDEEVAQVEGNQKTKARLLGAAEKSDPAGESTEIEYANYEHWSACFRASERYKPQGEKWALNLEQQN